MSNSNTVDRIDSGLGESNCALCKKPIDIPTECNNKKCDAVLCSDECLEIHKEEHIPTSVEEVLASRQECAAEKCTQIFEVGDEQECLACGRQFCSQNCLNPHLDIHAAHIKEVEDGSISLICSRTRTEVKLEKVHRLTSARLNGHHLVMCTDCEPFEDGEILSIVKSGSVWERGTFVVSEQSDVILVDFEESSLGGEKIITPIGLDVWVTPNKQRALKTLKLSDLEVVRYNLDQKEEPKIQGDKITKGDWVRYNPDLDEEAQIWGNPGQRFLVRKAKPKVSILELEVALGQVESVELQQFVKTDEPDEDYLDSRLDFLPDAIVEGNHKDILTELRTYAIGEQNQQLVRYMLEEANLMVPEWIPEQEGECAICWEAHNALECAADVCVCDKCKKHDFVELLKNSEDKKTTNRFLNQLRLQAESLSIEQKTQIVNICAMKGLTRPDWIGTWDDSVSDDVPQGTLCAGCGDPITDTQDSLACSDLAEDPEKACELLIHDNEDCFDAHYDSEHLKVPLCAGCGNAAKMSSYGSTASCNIRGCEVIICLEDYNPKEECLAEHRKSHEVIHTCPNCDSEHIIEEQQCVTHCEGYFCRDHCLERHLRDLVEPEIKKLEYLIDDQHTEIRTWYGKLELGEYNRLLESNRSLAEQLPDIEKTDYLGIEKLGDQYSKLDTEFRKLTKEAREAAQICRGCQSPILDEKQQLDCDLCPSAIHDKEECITAHSEAHEKYTNMKYGEFPAWIVDNSRFQPRTQTPVDEGFLKQLEAYYEESNGKSGNFQPANLVLINGTIYTTIGHRRTKGCKILGYPLLASLESKTEEQADKESIEDFIRKDLNLVDKIFAMARMSKEYNWSQEKIGQMFEEARSSVSYLIAMADLFKPDRLEELIFDTEFYIDEDGIQQSRQVEKKRTRSYLRAIRKIIDPELAETYLKFAYTYDWSTKEIDEYVSIHQQLNEFASEISEDIRQVVYEETNWNREVIQRFELEATSLHGLAVELQNKTGVHDGRTFDIAVTLIEERLQQLISEQGIDYDYLFQIPEYRNQLESQSMVEKYITAGEIWELEKDLKADKIRVYGLLDNLLDAVSWGFEYRDEIRNQKNNILQAKSAEAIAEVEQKYNDFNRAWEEQQQQKERKEARKAEKAKEDAIINCQECGAKLNDPMLQKLEMCKSCAQKISEDANSDVAAVAQLATQSDLKIVIDEVHTLDLRQLMRDLEYVSENYSPEIYAEADVLVDEIRDAAEVYRDHCYAAFPYRADKKGLKKQSGYYVSSEPVNSTLFSIKKLAGKILVGDIQGYETGFFDMEVHLVHIVLMKAVGDHDGRDYHLVPRILPLSLEYGPLLQDKESVFSFSINE